MKRMTLGVLVPAVCGLSMMMTTVACTDGGSTSSSSGTPGRSSSSSSSSSTGGGSSAGGGSSGIVASSNMGGSSGIVASSNMGGSSGIVASSGGGSGGNPAALGNLCTQATAATDCAGLNMPACFFQEVGATNGFCASTGCTVGQACAGAGTTCIQAGNNTACVRTCDPNGADGLCGAGKGCVGVSTGVGACLATAVAECNYVTMTPPCTAPATCGAVGTDGFGECRTGCDPFTVTSCPNAQTCQPDPMGVFGCIPRRTAMVGTIGAACEALNDCNTTLTCAGTGAAGSCLQLCDATHACPNAAMCQLFQGRMYGVCP